VQNIDQLLKKESIKGSSLEQKTKALGHDFAKLKVQMLKVGDGKNPQEKNRLIGQIQSCESALTAISACL
jgi:alkyl hydroperoxide reductase subunit AhpF